MDPALFQLLIFDNPRLDGPLMQADLINGVNLPMRALIVEETPGHVTVNYTNARAYCDSGDESAL